MEKEKLTKFSMGKAQFTVMKEKITFCKTKKQKSLCTESDSLKLLDTYFPIAPQFLKHLFLFGPTIENPTGQISVFLWQL